MLFINWIEPDADLGGTGFIPDRRASAQEVTQYLQGVGLEPGKRYPHQRCPIDPAHQSHSPNPVIALSGGIYCHSCAGRFGDGFRSFSSLVATRGGATEEGHDLLASAKHFAHWSHIRYVLAAISGGKTKINRVVYLALLKYAQAGTIGGDDDRMARVFRSFPFVRGEAFWLHEDTLNPTGHRISRDALEELPFARSPLAQPRDDGADGSAVDAVRVEMLSQNGFIPGLTPIIPVRGAPLHFHFNQAEGAEIIRAKPRRRQDTVSYVPFSKRMSPEQIASTLTSVYVGLKVPFVQLVMAAKGCAERGTGMVPYLLVHGVSGAAKTSTITLAGAALGEAPFCLANQKTDNFGEAIGSASRCSSLIVADEVFKSTGDKFTSTMRPILLAMGRRFDYRQLNIGTVSVQFNSAVFLCDTDLPEDLPEDEQFGRRFVYVNAPERTADWQKTGVDLLDFWRHTPEHRRAFDSLYSDLIDRFFGVGSRRSFQDIAEELGFLTYERYLLSTETGTLLQEKVIEVFWAVVDPANDKLPDHHKQGRGYCVVDFANHDHRITQALEALGAQAGRSIHAILPLVRKYNGRWHQLVNAKFPGRFDVLEFKGKTYVRFAHGETKGLVVNEQLADPIQLAQRQQKAAGQGVSL